jgi:hypothetical protein
MGAQHHKRVLYSIFLAWEEIKIQNSCMFATECVLLFPKLKIVKLYHPEFRNMYTRKGGDREREREILLLAIS